MRSLIIRMLVHSTPIRWKDESFAFLAEKLFASTKFFEYRCANPSQGAKRIKRRRYPVLIWNIFGHVLLFSKHARRSKTTGKSAYNLLESHD